MQAPARVAGRLLEDGMSGRAVNARITIRADQSGRCRSRTGTIALPVLRLSVALLGGDPWNPPVHAPEGCARALAQTVVPEPATARSGLLATSPDRRRTNRGARQGHVGELIKDDPKPGPERDAPAPGISSSGAAVRVVSARRAPSATSATPGLRRRHRRMRQLSPTLWRYT